MKSVSKAIWWAGAIVLTLSFIGLMLVSGDDPLSAAFIVMGRIACGFLAVLMIGGVLTDGYHVRRKPYETDPDDS